MHFVVIPIGGCIRNEPVGSFEFNWISHSDLHKFTFLCIAPPLSRVGCYMSVGLY